MKKLLKNKKVISVCLAVLLIAGIGYANYRLTGGATSGKKPQKLAAEEEPTADVFSQYKDERTSRRAEEISYIESVVKSEAADAQTKSDAEAKKLDLVSCMETELTTEGLIRTKMMVDSVVTVKDGAVNVVVAKEALTEEEVAQIADIVKAQTGQESQSIKIMPQRSVSR